MLVTIRCGVSIALVQSTILLEHRALTVLHSDCDCLLLLVKDSKTVPAWLVVSYYIFDESE